MKKELSSSQTIKVSILMNCRDGEKYLSQAIDSVYNQTYQNFEIIFIDNQSKDNTAKIAQGYDERLRYFRTPYPMTLYEARAYSVQFCTGEYFCVLDGDDYWVQDKLQYQIQFLSKNTNVSFLYGRAKYYYQDKPVKSLMVNLANSIKNIFISEGFRSLENVISNFDINLQTIMLKTDYVNSCGFNSKYNYIGDFDFHLRVMIKFDVKPYFLKKFVSTTRIHSTQLTSTTPGKWIREIKGLLVELILPNVPREVSRDFMKEINKKRFVYYMTKGMPLKALNCLKKYLVLDFYLSLVVSYKMISYFFKKTNKG